MFSLRMAQMFDLDVWRADRREAVPARGGLVYRVQLKGLVSVEQPLNQRVQLLGGDETGRRSGTIISTRSSPKIVRDTLVRSPWGLL